MIFLQLEDWEQTRNKGVGYQMLVFTDIKPSCFRDRRRKVIFLWELNIIQGIASKKSLIIQLQNLRLRELPTNGLELWDSLLPLDIDPASIHVLSH